MSQPPHEFNAECYKGLNKNYGTRKVNYCLLLPIRTRIDFAVNTGRATWRLDNAWIQGPMSQHRSIVRPSSSPKLNGNRSVAGPQNAKGSNARNPRLFANASTNPHPGPPSQVRSLLRCVFTVFVPSRPRKRIVH